jgi:2-oxoglutarate/2-oxoacid ferredoxin oxidoreductase subunit beta
MSNISSSSFITGHMPTWCPGCGDFGIWTSLREALSKLGIGPEDGVAVYGVGCHGNMYSWMKMYGFVGLHGRTLPVAQAIKLVNHRLPVVIISGDGDGLGEGGNHFLHAAKRNPDLTVILHDNQVYGLTTGQASPAAKQGFITKSTPEGVTDNPINPLALAITAGATFVARAFAGDTQGLAKIMMQAIEHKGFSIVDTLQPCVTFDKVHTYQWYRERVYYLGDDHDKTNKVKAFEKAHEWGDKIPLGIFYKEERPTAEQLESAIKEKPLVEQDTEPHNFVDVLQEFV